MIDMKIIKKARRTLFFAAVLLCLSLQGCAKSRPNILFILVDDLGYSDIEPFGSEISTPNLSELAASGTQFTNFHTAMKCNPTRAMLLTGLDNNISAAGGRRDWRVVADIPVLAEQLREAGYQTLMTGKWDAGSADGQRPFDRGFEHTFTLLPGVKSHYREPDGSDMRDDGTTNGYSKNGKDTSIPEDFYSTTFYSNTIIDLIAKANNDDRPFFAYLAYTAPHYPLQAPADSINRFAGQYDDGYQAINSARLARMRELDLLDADAQAWSMSNVPDWSSLSDNERAFEAKRMQVYAAMVAAVDDGVGRVLDFLDREGLTDNTLVIFASDNGADGTANGAGLRDTHRNDTDNLGNPSSYVTQGFNWAQVSSTPYRMVKSHPTEGGTRSPLIARWPGKIQAGARNDEWFRITDVNKAILEIAGVENTDTVSQLSGRSALPLLVKGDPIYGTDETVIHTYVEGRRLGGANVLRGPWKLVWWKENNVYGAPMLFNLDDDPMETTDIAADHPGIASELIREWHAYAAVAGPTVTEADPVRKAAAE